MIFSAPCLHPQTSSMGLHHHFFDGDGIVQASLHLLCDTEIPQACSVVYLSAVVLKESYSLIASPAPRSYSINFMFLT
jgi:hypothetical protein